MNVPAHRFRVGVHTSIAGGISKSVDRAASLHCSTMQIFSHNPRQWRKSYIRTEEADRFRFLRHRHDISPVFVHASYLINLASSSRTVRRKSIDLLSYELINADTIGADYVVLHTGSASGQDEDKARHRTGEAIAQALDFNNFKASLILENTAGRRGDITSSIYGLAELIDTCKTVHVGGICIDTCHAFSSGYDLTTGEGIERLMGEVNAYIGLDKLKLLHLNDSQRPLGSGVDRHEHIGKGFIGIRGFRKILRDERFSNVPIVLETPKKSEGDDRKNLQRVFTMLSRQP